MATSAKIARRSNRALAVIGIGVLDDAQMTWSAAEVDSTDALCAWCDAAGPDRAGAYVAYRAAADREAAAARDLQELYALTEPYRKRLRGRRD